MVHKKPIFVTYIFDLDTMLSKRLQKGPKRSTFLGVYKLLPFNVLYCYPIMTFLRNLRLLPLILLLPLFFSCSARIDGVLREGGAADLSITTALEPRTTALIRRIMGESPDTPVLDGPAISESISAAPGVSQSLGRIGCSPSAST